MEKHCHFLLIAIDAHRIPALDVIHRLIVVIIAKECPEIFGIKALRHYANQLSNQEKA